ncbi:MAG: ABC transporter permease, partial [Phycisphaerales bacterium]|nr:ABC transporter permease [Phycisphaerales bacterium]
QPSRVIATLGTAALLWLLLAGGLGRALAPGMGGEGAGYAGVLLPGMISLVALFGSVFASISLITDRHEGFLRGVMAGPAPRWSIAAGKLGGTLVVCLSQCVVLLLAAPVAGLSLDATHAIGALFAAAMMCLGVGGISLALAWEIDSVEGFHGVMNTLLMPMWLLSGAFYDPGDAHPVLRLIAAVNPLAWVTRVLRDALHAGGDPALVWHWAGSVLFAAAGAGAAWWSMARPRTIRAS